MQHRRFKSKIKLSDMNNAKIYFVNDKKFDLSPEEI